MTTMTALHTTRPAMPAVPAETNWRQRLPVLAGKTITLRELTLEDAPSLFAMLSVEELARFIRWTHAAQCRAGYFICFGVVPDGMTTAIGLFQVRSLEAGFATAEWGFALGSPFWGTGLFMEGAHLVLAFAFEQIGVHRLEARSAVHNGRGNGALRKTGAIQEGVLRKSFLKHGTYYDQTIWAIIDTDWQQCHRPCSETLH
jgi:ribosomal-protein-alanine N-acetyltransferase